jgi:predicted nucleotidyltransferase
MPTSHIPQPTKVDRSLARLRPYVLPLTQKYGVTNVRLFGSFARGEQRRTSDVDLLVDLSYGMTLLELVALKRELEAALKRKVDVVPARSIKPALQGSILADARPL